MAYRDPSVRSAVEMMKLPASKGIRRPTLSTYSWAGMVNMKLIIPEMPEAKKLPWRDGNPACEKTMGAKYNITSIYIRSDTLRNGTPVSC